jgi:hypothetical protein
MKRAHCTKPCKACPWKKTAGPGWLGASSPERFVLQVLSEVPLPCHLDIDYDDPAWQERWNESGSSVRLCAGALIFARNLDKLPRDPTTPTLDKSHAVFTSASDFISHHRSSVTSWGADEDRCGRTMWREFERVPFAPMILLAYGSPNTVKETEHG